jgi:hypothetical protein
VPAERRRTARLRPARKVAPRQRVQAAIQPRRAIHVAEVVDQTEASLLDLVDNLLNRGVMISGEVVLGVANVDLVYLRLMALLCAADRLLPDER